MNEFDQRKALIEKEEHFERWFATDVLGHRSSYNPLTGEVDEESGNEDSD